MPAPFHAPEVTPHHLQLLDDLDLEAALLDVTDGHIIDVNQTACRWLGYSCEDLLKMGVSDIETEVPVADGAWGSFIQSVRDHGGKIVTSGRHRRKDGSAFPVLISCALVTLGGREMLSSIAIDLSESHQLQAELEDVRSRAYAMLTVMPDPCFLVSKEGRFLAAFAYSGDQFGLPLGDLVGRTVEESFAPSLAERTRAAIDCALSRGEPEIFEFVLPWADRPQHWEARVVKRSQSDALILYRDLTVLRQTQIDLMEAYHLASLGELATSVAHEIRSPLSALLLQVELFRHQLRTPSTAEDRLTETADRIERVARHVTEIAAALGTFGQKQRREALTQVPVESLVHDSVLLCEEGFRSSGIDLDISVPSDLTIACHPGQIVQILVNLLKNARDAVEGSENPWCRLRVEDRQNEVVFSVTDSGPGIAPELRTRVMDPFFTTKALGRGIGLGLHISRQLAGEHGGLLEIDPTSEHTRFVLRLPRAWPPPPQFE